MNSLPTTDWLPRSRAGRGAAGTRRLAIVVLSLLAPLSFSSEKEDAQRELEDVVGKLNALDVWLDEAEERRVRWLGEVKIKDREVASVSEAVDEATAALAVVIRSLGKLEAEQRELQEKRERQATKIGEHLAAAYRLDGRDFVQLLLNQESPDSFDRMIRYHRYFSSARLSALQEYQETLEALAANRLALEDRAAEQEARKAELAERQARLIEERDQRRLLIAQLDAEAEDKAVQRQRLDTDRDRLERLLDELNRRAMELDGSAFVARKGSLPWPLKGPLRSSFGRPRADGRMVWQGMLVAADGLYYIDDRGRRTARHHQPRRRLHDAIRPCRLAHENRGRLGRGGGGHRPRRPQRRPAGQRPVLRGARGRRAPRPPRVVGQTLMLVPNSPV